VRRFSEVYDPARSYHSTLRVSCQPKCELNTYLHFVSFGLDLTLSCLGTRRFIMERPAAKAHRKSRVFADSIYSIFQYSHWGKLLGYDPCVLTDRRASSQLPSFFSDDLNVECRIISRQHHQWGIKEQEQKDRVESPVWIHSISRERRTPQ